MAEAGDLYRVIAAAEDLLKFISIRPQSPMRAKADRLRSACNGLTSTLREIETMGMLGLDVVLYPAAAYWAWKIFGNETPDFRLYTDNDKGLMMEINLPAGEKQTERLATRLEIGSHAYRALFNRRVELAFRDAKPIWDKHFAHPS